MTLTLLVLVPLLGSVAVLFAPRDRAGLARQIALGVSLVAFAISLVMWWRFDPTSADYQMVERHA